MFDSLVALCVAAIESIEEVAPMSKLVHRVKNSERIDAQVRAGAKEAVPHYKAIDSIVRRAVSLDAQLPIVTASPTTAAVYIGRVAPLRNTIFMLAAYDPDDVLWDIDLFLDQNRLPQRVKSTIFEALEYALNSDAEHFRNNMQCIEDALEFVEEEMFQADSWMANRARLFPMLLNAESYRLRGEFRRLIRESYLAFTFGLWTSCTALCRATVEFCVKQNCRKRGIRVTEERNGRRVERAFGNLVDDLLSDDKHLLDMVHRVRKLGNDVLHVGDESVGHDETAYEKRCRDAAEEANRLTRKIVERLHAFDTDSLGTPKASG